MSLSSRFNLPLPYKLFDAPDKLLDTPDKLFNTPDKLFDAPEKTATSHKGLWFERFFGNRSDPLHLGG